MIQWQSLGSIDAHEFKMGDMRSYKLVIPTWYALYRARPHGGAADGSTAPQWHSVSTCKIGLCMRIVNYAKPSGDVWRVGMGFATLNVLSMGKPSQTIHFVKFVHHVI